MGDLVFEFGRELVAAAEEDEGVAHGLGLAEEVLEPADEHEVGLFEVELQVAQEHDMRGLVGGEKPVERQQRFERVGARRGPAFPGVNQAVGRRPGVELALQGGADGGGTASARASSAVVMARPGSRPAGRWSVRLHDTMVRLVVLVVRAWHEKARRGARAGRLGKLLGVGELLYCQGKGPLAGWPRKLAGDVALLRAGA